MIGTLRIVKTPQIGAIFMDPIVWDIKWNCAPLATNSVLFVWKGKLNGNLAEGMERDAKKAGIDPMKPNGYSKALILPTSEEEICEIVEKVQKGDPEVNDWDFAACEFYGAFQTKLPLS